ncbi:polysaccharide lyase [Rhodobacter lacus]|uniref:Polysaccharide lyase n=1 Tax=Rhodobacter lacus TaxID=1641972 RepID=A0ABW5A813_9RHOB
MALALLAGGPLTQTVSAGPDPAARLLRDGFEGGAFSPQSGLYYRDNAEQRAGSYRFVQEGARDGQGALELRVVPHCAPDALRCSERAEVWQDTRNRVPYEEGVWTALSMRLGAPVPQDDHRYVMMQWKREIRPGAEGDFSPFLALRMRAGVLFATIESNYHPPRPGLPRPEKGQCPRGLVPVWLRPDTGQMRFLVAVGAGWRPELAREFDRCSDALRLSGPGFLPAARPIWHDYLFYTRPGPEGGGRIELVVDGRRVVRAEGVIGAAGKGLGKHQYFKFGPYRDAHQSPWTLYFDSFARGPACRAVAPASVCAGLGE